MEPLQSVTAQKMRSKVHDLQAEEHSNCIVITQPMQLLEILTTNY